MGLQSTGGLLLSVGLLLKYPLLPQLLMLLLLTADTIFISLVGLTASREKTQRGRETVSVIRPFLCFFKKKTKPATSHAYTDNTGNGLVCPTLLEGSLHESNAVTNSMAELLHCSVF